MGRVLGTRVTLVGSAAGFETRAQTALLILPSPFVSKRAHASPVWPVPVQLVIESQLQYREYLVASVSSRPIRVRSTWSEFTSFAPPESMTEK